MTIVRAAVAPHLPRTKEELLEVLQALVTQKLLRRAVVAEVESYPEDAILDVIDDTMVSNLPATVRSLRLEEFEALRHAAVHGAPPVPSPTPGAPDQFEVIRDHVRVLVGPFGTHALRITPVSRLRVVMVQTGYRRLNLLNPLVDCVFHHNGRDWYPGAELFGEGVFIDLHSGPGPESPAANFATSGNAASTWFNAWIDPEGFGQRIRSEDHDQLHPVFVWWHTLAHRIIKALAVDSGYSSAAVRERVFVDVDGHSGEAHGGVLLYTAQPGGDGTLGGLIALVPQFERVLGVAFHNLDSCSNDPLCGEETFAPGKYNGAACYACSLVSETSCEYRNMRLDRNLLLENLP